MAAPKGNRYGIDSGKFFKPKAFTPEEWKEVFMDYLSIRGEQEWVKNEAIKSGDHAGTIIKVPTQVPLTIESFCVFAGVTMQTFLNYEKAKGYEEYFDITTRIRMVIESDQLDGSTLGAYNPNIIARKLGLSEKTENKDTTNDVDLSKLNNEELKNYIDLKNKLDG